MKILFQGDSITDCGRVNTANGLGTGYALLVSSKLGYESPGKYEFINRGISGNRVTDVYTRIKSDIINLKPDFMSILIGVNDVWHEFNFQNGVSAEKYEKIYSMLIEEVKEALPDLKMMILEPFLTHGSAVDDKYGEFYCEVRKRAEAAKRIAEKYSIEFIPLQSYFDIECKRASDENWTNEGVHPTCLGHQMIANEWIKAFKKIQNL